LKKVNRYIFASVVFVFILVIFFNQIIFTKKVFFLRDTLIQFFPWRFYINFCLKNGITPLWNPYSFCGIPFLASLQTGIFYPVGFVFYLFAFPLAYKLYIFIHLFLAFSFMYLLLKEFNADDFSAFFSGMIFALNGFILTKLEFLSVLGTVVWFPLVFLILKKSVKKFCSKFVFLLAIIFSIQFFAGHPQYIIYEAILCFLYCFSVAIFFKNFYPVYTFFLSAFLSLFISAVQLIPSIEFILNSARAEKGFMDVFFTYSSGFKNFMDFANPLQKYSPNNWAYGNFCGITAFLLAIYSIRIKRKIVSFFWAVFLFSLFFALGKNNILFLKLYKYLPFSGLIRYPSTIFFLSVFSLAFLSGFVLRTEKSRFLKVLFIISAFVEIFFVGQKFNPAADEKIYMAYGDKIKFLKNQKGFFRFFLSPKTERHRKASGFNTFDAWIRWKDNLYGDVGLLFGLYNAGGQNVELADYYNFTDKIFRAKGPDDALKLLSLLSVRFLLIDYDFNSKKWKKVFEERGDYRIRIYENTKFLPLAYFVSGAKILKKEEILKFLKSEKFVPRREVVLEEGNESNGNISFFRKALILKKNPLYISLLVDAPCNGWLVLTEAFYPGWVARVDGKKEKILRANYFLKAVPVSRGKHIVEFFYKPLSFVIG